MSQSPLQQVKSKFGTKEALAAKVLGLIERPEGEEAADFERRIRTASNKQLLRLLGAEERVASEFGGKAGLVAAIVKFKFPFKGNPDYAAKLTRFTKTRLLDLHDSFRKAAAKA